MNFFEREFQRLFGDGRIIKHLSFAGTICWGWLNDDLRVRVKLTCSETAYLYDALNITVLDRMDKPIGTVLLKFQDVWGKQIVPGMPDCPDGIVPHIWTSRGKTEWHGWRPTPADREILRQQIRQCLKPFRDRAAERSPAQDQGIPVAFEQEAPPVRPAPQAVRPERGPEATSQDRSELLQLRLDQSYQDYLAQLREKPFDEVIRLAPEITAAQQICDELAAACDEEEAEYLLGLENPLETAVGYWEREISGYDHGEEMGHMLWHLRGCGREIPAATPAPKTKQKRKDNAHER